MSLCPTLIPLCRKFNTISFCSGGQTVAYMILRIVSQNLQKITKKNSCSQHAVKLHLTQHMNFVWNVNFRTGFPQASQSLGCSSVCHRKFKSYLQISYYLTSIKGPLHQICPFNKWHQTTSHLSDVNNITYSLYNYTNKSDEIIYYQFLYLTHNYGIKLV